MDDQEGAPMTLRAAVLGTGAWARTIHLPGLATHPEVELVGVWGRDPVAATAAGTEVGVPAFAALDRLLASVDLVSIAVTPAAQVLLATAAARAGVHVVLEKPAAPDAPGCRVLVEEAERHGIEATVFVSRLWDPTRQDWLTRVAGSQWQTITYDWVSAGMRPGMPGALGWRKDVGPLLDVAPHILSIVEFVAGPVVAVRDATTDSGGCVQLTLSHASGCTTTARLDLFAEVPSTQETVVLGAGGTEERWSNPSAVAFPAAYRAMLDDFIATISDPARSSPRGDESGLRRAAATAELLDEAARLLAAPGDGRTGDD